MTGIFKPETPPTVTSEVPFTLFRITFDLLSLRNNASPFFFFLFNCCDSGRHYIFHLLHGLFDHYINSSKDWSHDFHERLKKKKDNESHFDVLLSSLTSILIIYFFSVLNDQNF